MNARHFTECMDNIVIIDLAIPVGIAFDRFGRKQCLYCQWFEGFEKGPLSKFERIVNHVTKSL